MGEDGFVIDKLNADGFVLEGSWIAYRCPCFDGVGKRHGVLWTFYSPPNPTINSKICMQISQFFQKLFQGKCPHFNGHDIREGFHYRSPSTFLRRKRRCHRPWRLRCVGEVFRGDLWLIVYFRIFSFCHFAGEKLVKNVRQFCGGDWNPDIHFHKCHCLGSLGEEFLRCWKLKAWWISESTRVTLAKRCPFHFEMLLSIDMYLYTVFVWLFVYWSIYVSIYLFVCLPVCLSV